jgi:phosphopantetheine adenylyltransferase
LQVTDDAQAQQKATKLNQRIKPYTERIDNLAAFLDAQTPVSIAADFEQAGISVDMSSIPCIDCNYPYRNRYTFIELHDSFGNPIIDPSYTTIVCSEETKVGCDKINEIRTSKGMNPLRLVVAPLVRDEEGRKLSSTLIRQSEA